MTHRPPLLTTLSFSRSWGLNRALVERLSCAESASSETKTSLLALSSKLGSLICTMGLVAGNVWLSSGRLPAIAHAVPTHSPLLPQNHLIGSRTPLPFDPDLTVLSSHHLDNTANQNSSPWGEPYTGSGTSTDSRGSCPGVSAPLVALIPDGNHGRSLSAYPTFWFYVPYNTETIDHGVFLLQDENHNDVITPLTFSLSNTPGFVSVTLPASEQPLKANNPYHWYFELYCQDNHVSPVSVDGWIEKTSLVQIDSGERSASPLLESRPDFSFYPLYRQNFIWFDAVDAVIQEWSEMPNEQLTEELLSLLQSANVDLEEWPANSVPTPVLPN